MAARLRADIVRAVRVGAHAGQPLLVGGVVEEPAAHVGQLAQGDGVPAGDAGDVAGNGVVEAGVALVDELEKPAHSRRRFTVGY